jgi:hypothetical protein
VEVFDRAWDAHLVAQGDDPELNHYGLDKQQALVQVPGGAIEDENLDRYDCLSQT